MSTLREFPMDVPGIETMGPCDLRRAAVPVVTLPPVPTPSRIRFVAALISFLV